MLTSIAVLTPLLARANPVAIDGTPLFAFVVVAFWALIIEAGIAALLLVCRGVAPLPMFLCFFIVNSAVFTLMFHPLNGTRMPLPVQEALVVFVDGIAIKLLTRLGALQGNDYRGLGWAGAMLVSVVGNAASYFVGAMAAETPWIAPLE